MLIVFIRFVWESKSQKMDQVWIQIPRVSLEYTDKQWELQFLSSEPFLFLSISSLTALVLALLNSGLLILGFNYRFLSQNIIQRSQTCLLLIRENYIYSSNCYDMT